MAIAANKTSPRVLVITDRFLPEVGGTITWFENSYRRYPPGTVWILTQNYPGAREVDARFEGVSITRRKLRRYIFLRPESLLLYAKLFIAGLWIALRRKIDIIHAGKVLPEGLVAKVLSKVLGIPYVVYAHGEEIKIFSKNPKLAPELPKVYDHADAIISNSMFTQGCLVEHGCHGRNTVRISPGVSAQTFQPGPRDAELIRKHDLAGKLVLLSVGRHQKRKGQDRVIQALPRILPSCPNLVYVITSTGEEESNLRKLAQELGVAGAVRFTGEVTLHELPSFYNTCDIFILPNRTLSDGDVEGFGIVFLEASACQKPVIAGDSGGTGDPVRDGWNGYRVDGNDLNKIAEVVIRLAKDPALRETMGRNGRALVEAEYTWDRVVEKTRRLDQNLVNGRGPTLDDNPEPRLEAPPPNAGPSLRGEHVRVEKSAGAGRVTKDAI